MRATIERVLAAGIETESHVICSIKQGLCVQVAFHEDDTFEDIEYMVKKVLSLKFFTTDDMNCRRNVIEAGLEILCVSQPNFFAVVRGNKTSFPNAMDDERSEAFYLEFLAALRHNYKSEKISDCGLSDRKEVRAENEGGAMSTVDTRA